MTAGFKIERDSEHDFVVAPDRELTSELVKWTRQQCAGPIGGDYAGWIRELKRYDKSVRKCVRVWGSGMNEVGQTIMLILLFLLY